MIKPKIPWIMVFMVSGCLQRPYEPYFEDPADGPVLTGVEFDPDTSFVGGTVAQIRGGRLDTTRTVVVGGRNARILDTDFDTITLELPSHAQTGEALDLVVVTDFGISRLDGAVVYRSHLGGYAADERVSVALGRVECPIEGYGYDGEILNPILWCGAEFGFADAIGFSGNGVHPGYATEILGVAPLGSAPPVGEARFYGPNDPRPPSAPLIVGPHAAGDAIRLTTARDFARDLRVADSRFALVEDRYFWAPAIDPDSVRQVAAMFDADGNPLGQARIDSGEGDTLRLSEAAPPGTTGVWTGFRFVERYEGDPTPYETLAWTGTAEVSASGDALSGASSGAELVYDEFSGFFFPRGVAGLFGQSEIVRQPYEVSTVRVGETTVHGTVLGPRPRLELLSPDLLSGSEFLRTDEALEVHWVPDDETGEPSIVVFELKVYDLDVRDPEFQTELYRVVAAANDVDGRLRIPAFLMEALPERVENRIDENFDFVGMWGDVTIARHQLRKLRLADDSGDIVVDFVSSLNAPVGLGR